MYALLLISSLYISIVDITTHKRCEVGGPARSILSAFGNIEMERSHPGLYLGRCVTSDWSSHFEEIVRRSNSVGASNLRRFYMVREMTRLSDTICECVG